MRTYDPSDKYDQEEAARLKAEPWHLELLGRNPSYVSWGPHEDYMWKDKESWDSRVIVATWPEFQFGLDDYNECVNFYFSVCRDSRQCETCGGSGYHPDAQWVSESFYGHSTPFRAATSGEILAKAVMANFGGDGRRPIVDGFPSDLVLTRYSVGFREFCEAMKCGDGVWHDKITEDEAVALVQEGRARGRTSASEINALQKGAGIDSHDAINRGILIRTRCARFGIPVQCASCEGHGEEFISDEARISLTLWILHPRKGCSRGVEVTRVTQAELPAVFEYLREAAKRNAGRFEGVMMANTDSATAVRVSESATLAPKET